MDKNKWVKTFFIGSIVIILMVSGINYIVNPYNVFGHGYDKYFPNKTEILSDEMTKFYVANRLQPKTIMIGTSRIGFFQESQLTPYLDAPIYNLALSGSSIDEQASHIEYMIKHHHIKNIIWSLDFFSFNPTKPINPPFEEKCLSNDPFWNDYLISLFNLKTFNKSIETIKSNYLPSKNNTSKEVPNKEEIERKIDYTLKEYATKEAFLKSEPFKIPSSIDRKVALVKKTIAYCHENNVSVTLYTSPVYYKHIDMYYSMGLGDTFEYWKKSLADIQPYTDFCVYNSISYDMMKFRDSSHAISNVGELVFIRIFDSKLANSSQNFGYTVTPYNINQHLNQQKRIRHDFSF